MPASTAVSSAATAAEVGMAIATATPAAIAAALLRLLRVCIRRSSRVGGFAARRPKARIASLRYCVRSQF
ncbi:hypothetical protein GCM10010460_16870 [Microbacterium terrae]|nr:hypothetical protein GCM10017594_12370 [Microbacterium terrae]